MERDRVSHTEKIEIWRNRESQGRPERRKTGRF